MGTQNDFIAIASSSIFMLDIVWFQLNPVLMPIKVNSEALGILQKHRTILQFVLCLSIRFTLHLGAAVIFPFRAS